MAASKTMTAQQRTARARLAASTSWANTTDRSARTAAARAALVDRWERKVDEDGSIRAQIAAAYTAGNEQRAAQLLADLTWRAEHLKRAHMLRMALASSKARGARKAAGEQSTAS